jgi:hypothetical protein
MKRMSSPIFLTGAMLFLTAILAQAGQDKVEDIINVTSPTLLTPQVLLTMAFCILGLFSILFQFILFYRSPGKAPYNNFVVGLCTQTIIIAVIVLVATGYSPNQAEPAFALLGAALGYLLGKGEGLKREADNTEFTTGEIQHFGDEK